MPWPIVAFMLADNIGWGDLLGDRLEMGWAVGLALMEVAELQVSAAQYRHVGVGEDFEGYN